MAPSGPLSDIIVVDLTRVLAGPFCTMLLADLGARVIKVENPGGGDDSRAYGPFINGKSGYFIAQNRGKESIALDLKSADDLVILHRLLKAADVVVENFRPGTMERLGLGWPELHARYPKLIYAAASGFGHTGPYAQRAAYDVIAQAMGGIMSITGHEGNPPTRVGSSIGDLGAGLFTTVGVLTALHHRERAGEGMKIDVAMLDCQIALLENAVTRYFASGEPPKRLGARHPSIAPFEPYQTKDGYVVIACGNDELFRKLCRTLKCEALAEDQRFSRNAKRAEHVLLLKASLEDILRHHPTQHWLDLLLPAGIPCAPINDVGQAVHDPQIQARNMVLPVDDASVAPLMVAGLPIKMSAYADAERRPAAPELDADRARILRDFPLSRPTMRRALKWIGLGLLGLVVLLIAVAAGGFFWLRSSLPQQDGTVTVAGLSGKVTIDRDDRGVVTIHAADLDDAEFAVGFAHAQDRLFQMEMMRRVGAGRLAEVVGPPAVATDRLMRTLGLYALARQQADAASPQLKTVLEAYSAGVNAFLAQHNTLPPEFHLLHFAPEPWTPADSLVWGRIMALQLSSNWNEEQLDLALKQQLAPDFLKLLLPEAQSFAGLPAPWFGPLREASNNWVVAPGKSKDGAALLANDPHLGLTAPSIWYLVHIVTPEMSWVGATSPGMPLIVIGANDHVAWGFTTTGGDTEDLFEEKPVAGDPARYRTYTGPAAFQTRKETIKVKGAADDVITVRSTYHGPVVSDLDADRQPDAPMFSLEAAFLQPGDRTADALLAMDLAQSADRFHAALAGFDSPEQNVVYADRDGHIGFVAAGRVPVRRKVFADGLLPAPGWVNDYDWTGTIPFDALPQAKDPASGWLATANNKIVDDGFPYFMAGRWPDDGRYQRIAELLQAKPQLDVTDFENMQRDILSKPLLGLVRSWLPQVPGFDPKIRDLLGQWDGRMDRDRPEPLIATLWMQRTAQLLLKSRLGDSYADWWFWDDQALQRVLRAPKWCADDDAPARSCAEVLTLALKAATDELTARLGSDPTQWKWGDLHRMHFRHPVLRYVPVLSRLLDPDLPVDGDAFTLNRSVPIGNPDTPDLPDVHGPTMRLIVDLKDPMGALINLAGGQSGNPLSAHYADWLQDWRDGRYRPIVQPAVHTLQLVPKS